MRGIALLGLLACAPPDANAPVPLTYPPVARGDVIDDYFGTPVADPYCALELTEAPETQAWIAAENALTRAWLDAVPARAALRARLGELKDYERVQAPSWTAGRLMWWQNSGLQRQAVLMVADGLDGAPRALLDPNTLSDDGTVAVMGGGLSEDGRWLAYGLSDGGSDWRTWRVRDVETGQDLPDVVRWSKFSGVSWDHHNQGFYYGRYPEPTTALLDVNLNNAVWYHRLGTSQAEDRLIYARPDQPTWGLGTEVTEDGTTLLITAYDGSTPKNRLYWQDLRVPDAPVRPLIESYEAEYSLVGSQGRTLWLLTNQGAPNSRVIAVDLDQPDFEHPRVILPERPESLVWVSWVGGRLFAAYVQDAHSVVRIATPEGAPLGEVALPGLCSAGGFGGRADDPQTFYTVNTYTSPPVTYRYDVATGQSTPWRPPALTFDPSAYTTEQVFVTSKDGTRVPMFLVYKQGLKRDGSNPTILYGYGGFNISILPGFDSDLIAWLERGGVYASANLRGGAEYGERWHEAGTLERKQNVFDDAIAAAEYLIREKITRPDRLAIRGRSNGGLLVGAVMTQRPDLIGAAVPAVGVMDMLRYHRFTIGRSWAGDYGRSDDPKMFPILLAYSPYHNIRLGVTYPATLVLTGDHDDRVVPGHSLKFAAALQYAQAGPAPVLLRVETRAGHGAGRPTDMLLDESADVYAFLLRALRLEGGGA